MQDLKEDGKSRIQEEKRKLYIKYAGQIFQIRARGQQQDFPWLGIGSDKLSDETESVENNVEGKNSTCDNYRNVSNWKRKVAVINFGEKKL